MTLFVQHIWRLGLHVTRFEAQEAARDLDALDEWFAIIVMDACSLIGWLRGGQRDLENEKGQPLLVTDPLPTRC